MAQQLRYKMMNKREHAVFAEAIHTFARDRKNWPKVMKNAPVKDTTHKVPEKG